MPNYINGEIEYHSENKGGMIHSDFSVSPANTDRAVLHELLDEWLDKGNGTGGFYVGNCTFMPENMQDVMDLFHYVKEQKKNV